MDKEHCSQSVVHKVRVHNTELTNHAYTHSPLKEGKEGGGHEVGLHALHLLTATLHEQCHLITLVQGSLAAETKQ